MNRGVYISPSGENKTISRQKLSRKDREHFTPDDDFIKENRINLDITHILNPIDGKPFISRDELDQK